MSGSSAPPRLHEVELIDHREDNISILVVDRTKVNGGWIYTTRNVMTDDSGEVITSVGVSTVFVKDLVG